MTKYIVHFLLFAVFVLPSAARSRADDAWFVDTRNATLKSSGETIEHLDIKRLQLVDGRMQWVQASPDEFIETHDPSMPTVVIIHGNWMTYPDAQAHGMMFHRMAVKYGRHRLVVWSWPSERTRNGIKQDALLKAKRADVQAKFLATCLRHLPEESKVSLVGFSFGARLVCQTLQFVATSSHEGRTGHRLRLRAVLLGAAVEQNSLLPNRKYGNALDMVETMLVHVNSKDNTLCWYPLLVGVGGPKAMGKEGPFTRGLSPANFSKIHSKEVKRLIGHDHGFKPSLLGLLAVRGDYRNYCLFE